MEFIKRNHSFTLLTALITALLHLMRIASGTDSEKCIGRILPSCDDPNLTTGVCLENGSTAYLQFEPPRPWPVQVKGYLEFSKVFSFDINEGTLTLPLYIESWWNDARLSVRLPDYYDDKVDSVPIPQSMANKIWNPKVEIQDAKSEQDAWTDLAGKPPDEIIYSKKAVFTIMCDTTHLDEYPLDHYVCDISLGSTDGNYLNNVNLTEWLVWDEELQEKNDDFYFRFSEALESDGQDSSSTTQVSTLYSRLSDRCQK